MWYNLVSLRQRRNRFSSSCSSLARFLSGDTASLEREPDEADAVGLAVVIIRGAVNDSDG